MLGSYLAVLGLDGSTERACLRRGQFHDVGLAGEVAYRFPQDEESRRRLPARVRLLEALAAAAPGILDWDEAHLGSQADDLAPLATMLGWPAAERLDRRRHGGRCPTIEPCQQAGPA